MKFGRLILILAAGMLLTACSGMKDIPADAVMLHRVVVIADSSYSDIQAAQLKPYVLQHEQTRWFGLVRKPVVFDSLLAIRSSENLRSALFNKGYLNARVELQLLPAGERRTDALYVLHPGQPYLLNSMKYEFQDTLLGQVLRPHLKEFPAGNRFSVETLEEERKRLTQLLTNNGYYRFNKTNISYRADSTIGHRQVDVTMVVHRYHPTRDIDTLHQQYRIGDVRFLSGDDDGLIPLRQGVLRSNTFIQKDSLYSAADLQNTYSHFSRLGVVRYTNINFRERPDTNLLDCDIQLSTNKPNTLSFQPEGTNTAGDLGAAASLTYQNSNLFRGSEVLSLQLRGAYEAIRGLEGYSNQDFREYSVETRLQYPRFIVPFVSRDLRRRLNATSEVSLLYDLQDRPEFHRRVLSAAWRYRWNLPGRHDRYQLDLLDLNYVFMPWISSTFRNEYLDSETSRNSILRFNYEDLFITKIGFGYSYTKGNLAVKTNIETSGNGLSLATHVLGTHPDSQGQRRLLNIAFAQYAKADLDLTRSVDIDQSNQIVFHLGLGIAYPYGNSRVLPFEKRYFAGGANSVRGWSVRSLGPGKYKERDGRINFINQTGDMKLDLNVEYRTRLFWKLSGAAFIDAGNIWTLREYDIQPGGQFSLKDLPSQLAASYGLGLRINFDYFILRFDLGMKAVNPAYEDDDDEHYPLLHPRFSRDYAFHFAVGMPF